MNIRQFNKGFTLVEIAIVLIIVTLLIGFTIALFPKQQELNRYRKVNAEMDVIINSLISFAQVNGRLPCPALPNSGAKESGGGASNCNNFAGFVPSNTLGLYGDINQDGLLLDPWGQPYRYYVSDSDFFEDADSDGDLNDDAFVGPDGDDVWDFVRNGEMKDVGISDLAIDEEPDGDDDIEADDIINLDGNLVICDGVSSDVDRCTGSNEVMGDVIDITPTTGDYTAITYTMYRGVPAVLLSLGKDGADTPIGDQLANKGATNSVAGTVTGNTYMLDTDTVFVKRTTGISDDFDDVVKWISPNILYSKMIEAGQLP